MINDSIRRVAEEIAELYNKLHGAEARATVLGVDKDEVIVEFAGSFCHSCGVIDWVEDYAYLAMSMGYNLKLVKYIEPSDIENRDYKRIGVFKLDG